MKILFFLLPIMLFELAEAADCKSPFGKAGELTYISITNRVKFCSGTGIWTDTYQSLITTCSPEPAGKIKYLAGDLRYCNGTNWISMKGSLISTCPVSETGMILYQSGIYFYCDGTNTYNLTAGANGCVSTETNQATGTYTVPANCHWLYVKVWGAGGGSIGGGGGYTSGWIPVTPGDSISVTVGTGGSQISGGTPGSPGGAGCGTGSLTNCGSGGGYSVVSKGATKLILSGGGGGGAAIGTGGTSYGGGGGGLSAIAGSNGAGTNLGGGGGSQIAGGSAGLALGGGSTAGTIGASLAGGAGGKGGGGSGVQGGGGGGGYFGGGGGGGNAGGAQSGAGGGGSSYVDVTVINPIYIQGNVGAANGITDPDDFSGSPSYYGATGGCATCVGFGGAVIITPH